MSKKKYCQPTLMTLSCTTEGEVFAASLPSGIQDGGAFNVVSTRTPLQSFSSNTSSTSSSVSSDYGADAKDESVSDLLDEF